MSIKVWPFRPDWESGVLEKLEWLTDLMGSTKGAEQRRPQRLTPRRSLEATFLPHGRERSMFDLMVMQKGNDDWYIPLWYDVDTLRLPIAASTTLLPIDYDHRELQAGAFALIRSQTQLNMQRNTFTYEVIKVVGLKNGKVEVLRGQEGTAAMDWGTGSEVYPLKKARFTNQPTANVVTASIQSVTVQFSVTEPNEWYGQELYSGYGRTYGISYGKKANRAPLTPAQNLGRVVEPQYLPTFEKFRVLTAVPDYNQEMTFSYERTINDLDNDNSIPLFYDTLGFGQPTQQHTWFLKGRREVAAFRTLMYWLRGRVRPIWVPTFNDDVQLIARVSKNQLYIDVKNIGYTDIGGGVNRQCLAFQLNNGKWFFRRILVTSLIAGGERMELNEAFPDGLEMEDVYKISFMCVSRMAQDTVEMSHVTDTKGLTKAVITFKAVPDLRQYAVWRATWPSQFRECNRECGQMPRVEDRTNYGPPDFNWSIDDALTSATYAYITYKLGYSQKFLPGEVNSVSDPNFQAYLAWQFARGYLYDEAQAKREYLSIFSVYQSYSMDSILTLLDAKLPAELFETISGYPDDQIRDYFLHLNLLSDHNSYLEGAWALQTSYKRNWLPMRQLNSINPSCSDGMLGRFCVQNRYNRDYLSRYPSNSRGSSTLYMAGAIDRLDGVDPVNWPTDISLLGQNYTHEVVPANGNGVHYSCGCILLQFLESHAGLREQKDTLKEDPEWVLWWHRASVTLLTPAPWPTAIQFRLYDALTGFLLRTIDLDVQNYPVQAYADELQVVEWWRYGNDPNVYDYAGPGPAPEPQTYTANLVNYRVTYGREEDKSAYHADPWDNIWHLVPINSQGFIVEVYPR
jgi:hypothetical protein